MQSLVREIPDGGPLICCACAFERAPRPEPGNGTAPGVRRLRPGLRGNRPDTGEGCKTVLDAAGRLRAA